MFGEAAVGVEDSNADHIHVVAGFANSGQACIAGTRILVPASRLDEAMRRPRWSGVDCWLDLELRALGR